MIYLSLPCALIAVGLYGVLTRRDLVGLLASAEVMIGGALVLLITLAAVRLAPEGAVLVEGVGLLVLVLAAAEAAVGLALVVAVARRTKTTRIDELTEVKG